MYSATVNRYSLSGDHAVPSGWKVVELKYCENCMTAFSREACSCRYQALLRGAQFDFAEFKCECKKYCANCIGRLLLPLDLQDYKTTLPREAEMRHAHHLPRYDNSLLPKEHQRVYTHQIPAAPPRRNYLSGRLGNWRERLEAKFRSTPEGLTGEQIQDVVGWSGGPEQACQYLRRAGFAVTIVGKGPRRSPHGVAPNVYQLTELVSPVVIDSFMERLEQVMGAD